MIDADIAQIHHPAHLEALRCLGLLNSSAEPAFDRLTRLATKLLRTPAALISLVEADRQFYKSGSGLPKLLAAQHGTPRPHLFCQHVKTSGKSLVLNDARTHPLAHDDAISEMNIAAYAGIPLITTDGHILGTFCVLDSVPHSWTANDITSLQDLAASMIREIELRSDLMLCAQDAAAIRERETYYQMFWGAAERQVRNLALMDQLRAALADAADQSDIFRIVVDVIAATGSYAHVGLHLLQDGMLTLHHQARTTDSAPSLSRIDSVIDHVARTGQSVLLEDVCADAATLSIAEGVGTNVGVPIFDHEQIIGVLHVAGSESAALSASDLRRLTAISEHVAAAIEHVRLQQHAQKYEHLHRSIIDTVKDVIFQTDLHGAWTFLNPAWAEITGFPIDLSLGKPMLDFVHPADRQTMLEKFTLLIQGTSGSCRYETRFLTHDGGTRWIEGQARIMTTADGTIIGIAGTLHDLTGRKLHEVVLRESEERFRQLAENIHEAFFLISGTLAQIIYVSPAYEEIWGRTCASLYEQPDTLLEAVHLDDRTCFVALLQRADKTGHECRECRIVRPDGTIRWIRIHAFPIYNDAGQCYRIACMAEDITEGKDAEAELAWLASFPDLTPYPIVELDPEGAITYLNPAARELFPDMVQGRDHAILTELRSVLRSVPHHDAPLTLACELTYNNHVYEYHTSYLTDRRRTRAYLRDVTLRKRAEEERDRFFTLSFDMIGITGFDGYFKRLNPAFERTLGFTIDELLTTPFLNMIHPDDIDMTVAELQKLITNEVPTAFENRCRCKDGSYKWIQWISTPYVDQDLLYGTARDVTARRQAEDALQRANDELEQRVAERTAKLTLTNTMLQQEISERQHIETALRESELRFRLLAENSTDMISQQDTDGVYHYISPACQALLGYSPDELLGQSFQTFIHPDDIDQLSGITRAVEAGANILTFSHRFRHKDGRYLWVESGFRIMRDEQTGTIQEIQVASRNITERKEAEDALIGERTLLARRVEERTKELSVVNLELARAARLKDEFLASMSHELRTPLNAVLGLSEALLEYVYGPLNERQLKALQGIAESGRHLLALINDILDLSKIEAGKLKLEFDTTVLETLCQASLRFVRQAALQKQLCVLYVMDSAVTTVWADERRLKQILVNLLSNAVKFTPVGGTIGLEVHADAVNHVVHLSVWDTGIGIGEEKLGHLFQPFIQLDSSLARQYAGTGLGLALVARMIEMHGGGVTVESNVGKGSRFTVWLPWHDIVNSDAPIQNDTPILVDEQPAGAPELDHTLTMPAASQPADARLESNGVAAQDAISPADVPPDPNAQVIVLAEDNEDNIAMLADYLRGKHYQVVIARNGQEAIMQARATRPALILMDIQMPGMDGLEATQCIRADAELAAIPIIALTALAMRGDRDRCLAAGVNDYLSKPIKLQQLTKIIETYLQPT
jgi:PAS domain S-box-containing protein